MHNSHKLIALLVVLATTTHAEGLLSRQPGTAINANDWTLLTPSGYPPTMVGFEHAWYAPGISSMVGVMSYRVPFTEIQVNWTAYSVAQNRFDILSGAAMFHDAYWAEGGHSEGGIQVDPIFSMAYGPCCYSGSNAPENSRGGSYWFDFVARQPMTKASAGSLSVNVNQPMGAFDPFNYRMVSFGGDGSSQTFSEYTPSTNSWSFNVSTTGTCPITGLQQHSMALNTLDTKIYIFGGSAGGTVQNTLFTYNPTSHVCAQLSPSGGPPTARQAMAWAYDSADNIFLLYGGINQAGGLLNDTWVYDPVANTWTQLSPTHAPATPTAGVFDRIAYFPEEDIFIMWAQTSTGQGTDLYAFRYRPGQNAGYVTGSFATAPGSMNRNISGFPTWSQGTWLTQRSGVSLLVNAETGGPADTSSSSYYRPYAQTVTSGTSAQVPSPSAYNSIAPDVGGGSTPVLTANPSITYVGTVPWTCWTEQNPSMVSRAQCKGYSLGSWSVGGVIGISCAHSGNCTQGQTQIADVNGTPTVIWREQDSGAGFGTPNIVNAFVKQWTGSWTQLGGALNVSSGQSLIESVSIASNGTFPYAAWTEYTAATIGSPPSTTFTAPQVYLYLWGGSSWAQQCGGSGNVNTSNRAYSVSVTYLGSTPYLAWAERTTAGYNSLYIRKCSGGSWSTVAGPLNRDSSNGWVFKPSLTNDGTDLYVAWDEQGNQQPWVGSYAAPANVPIAQRNQIYAAKVTTAGVVTYLGGSLNADTFNGAASQPTIITTASATPVVAWGEVNQGSLRQLYSKVWNGSNWNILASPVCALTPPIIGPYTVGQVVSQTFSPSGCAASTCSITSGSLGSSGLSLGGASNCVLSGTVTVAGSYSFTMAYSVATNPISMLINSAPSVTTSGSLTAGTQGSPYSQSISTSGGTAPLTCALFSGSLAGSGLTLNSNCTVTGTGGTPASYGPITVKATDANGIVSAASSNITVTINPVGGTPFVQDKFGSPVKTGGTLQK